MNLLRYQGAGPHAPGDAVEYGGLSWIVTAQGHLITTVVEADYPIAVDLIRSGSASELIAPGGPSIAATIVEAQRAAEVAAAED